MTIQQNLLVLSASSSLLYPFLLDDSLVRGLSNCTLVHPNFLINYQNIMGG